MNRKKLQIQTLKEMLDNKIHTDKYSFCDFDDERVLVLTSYFVYLINKKDLKLSLIENRHFKDLVDSIKDIELEQGLIELKVKCEFELDKLNVIELKNSELEVNKLINKKYYKLFDKCKSFAYEGYNRMLKDMIVFLDNDLSFVGAVFVIRRRDEK